MGYGYGAGIWGFYGAGMKGMKMWGTKMWGTIIWGRDLRLGYGAQRCGAGIWSLDVGLLWGRNVRHNNLRRRSRAGILV